MTYTLRSQHKGDFWINLPDEEGNRTRSVRIPPRGVVALTEDEFNQPDVQAAVRAGVLAVIKKE